MASDKDENIFKNLGVEITLKHDENFLKVKETLTRIGIASTKTENSLFQTCHILHKKGHYAIMHFKEMFILDGKPSTLTEDDKARRNTITALLEDWNLIDIVNNIDDEDFAPMTKIKVISHAEKKDWKLVPKYLVGKKNNV